VRVDVDMIMSVNIMDGKEEENVVVAEEVLASELQSKDIGFAKARIVRVRKGEREKIKVKAKAKFIID
jgi:hypothetical protein